MRQLLQDVSSGEVSVREVPTPSRGATSLLVSTRRSVISPGTERSAIEQGQASMISKARARPDLARQVIDSARTDGLMATYEKVRGRMGEPNALGYSLSGVVIEACDGAPAAPGDIVACAGAGLASHAEVVAVPRNLCARVPAGVDVEDAAYATIAAIALHGVRLAEIDLGSVVAVIGLGLVGQLTIELVMAAGAIPVGMDPDLSRVELARSVGALAVGSAEELESECRRLTSGRGADASLVTAASSSAAPLTTACAVARERAVVAIVGDVAIQSPRAPLFSKELRLVVSRSYGPGRYDPRYEREGIDYPAGYVRWTEGRNLAEVVRLMSADRLHPSRLTSHHFDLSEGAEAYSTLASAEPSLGIVLRYPEHPRTPLSSTVQLSPGRRRRSTPGTPRLGVIGAGSFARATLLPAVARHCSIAGIANATGVSAVAAAQRFGAAVATTDPDELIGSSEIDALLIATRHDSHAELAVRALEAGKHVFVEKPVGLTYEEVDRVAAAAAASEAIFMVGFNRRFAPLAARLADAVSGAGPLIVNYRVNAGRLPASHWTHHPAIGGGRIIGEVCHFVDFASYLAGASPIDVTATAVGGGSEPREDNLSATLQLEDGSVAQIVYSAFGDSSLEKERIEVYGERGAGVLVDFQSLVLHMGGKSRTLESKRDKGHAAELAAFTDACRSGEQPWPLAQMLAVSRATVQIRDAIAAVPSALETEAAS